MAERFCAEHDADGEAVVVICGYLRVHVGDVFYCPECGQTQAYAYRREDGMNVFDGDGCVVRGDVPPDDALQCGVCSAPLQMHQKDPPDG